MGTLPTRSTARASSRASTGSRRTSRRRSERPSQRHPAPLFAFRRSRPFARPLPRLAAYPTVAAPLLPLTQSLAHTTSRSPRLARSCPLSQHDTLTSHHTAPLFPIPLFCSPFLSSA